MSEMSHRTLIAVLLIAIGLPAPRSVAAQVSSQGLIQAAGRPYVDCVGGPAQLLRMENAIREQRRVLEKTRELLRNAEAGHAEATQQTEDAIMEAAKKAATEKLTLLKRVKALKELGLSQEKRREFLELVKSIEDRLEHIEKSSKRNEAYDALMQSGMSLQNLGTFLESSGMNDDTAVAAATALAGPAGAGAVEVFILARDLVFAGAGQVISENELAQARQNNAVLENAVRLHEDRIDRLRALLAEPGNCPPPKPAAPESPKPVPEAEAHPSPPTAGKTATFAKRLGLSLGIATATGLGALYAVNKALASADSSADGDGSGSGSVTFVRVVNPFVCQGNGCTGSIEINVGVRVTSGFVTAGTDSLFLGQVQVAPNSTPGRVTLKMDKTPYITCYATQTRLAVWDSQFINGPVIGNLSVNIPVSCR